MEIRNIDGELIESQDMSADNIAEKITQLFMLNPDYAIIQREMNKKYGVSVSTKQISVIISKLIPVMHRWQTRPLNQIYPFVWLYGASYKTREARRYVNKIFYCVLALDLKGKKQVLGVYFSEKSQMAFWRSVFSDLKSRGVEDILVVNHNGSEGVSEGISAVYPQSKMPLCIMDQLHISLKNIAAAQRQSFMIDVNQMLCAPSRTEIDLAWGIVEQQWEEIYPSIIQSWRRKWPQFEEYFDYPSRIRQGIYNTNMIESFHKKLGFLVNSRMIFPNENNLMKLVYLGIMKTEKSSRVSVKEWHPVLSQLVLHFEGRLDKVLF
ncbi:IS256 family transposase [Moellerella wisconsensis]|uniref:Transposase n=2 Tax=Moellerella wisconsensis TaxID=158849 RepID=A0ACD3Y925_9GAMM|nr:transposase [Moellerella wisconsensis]UNH23876.1 transposase [Moellerella wisconsensis]UNH30449.1 transposase [Moellerella wisconsensis]UNH38606.1 transposase [Moellerella wisconsensis]UNH42127.1 transposase [Moellerella wisconsensis]WJW81586.1 transposase [Moellerella wisconsensis]